MVETEIDYCPECGVERTDFEHVCSACGAPPRSGEIESSVRTTDLEPYIALRYIARLFKVLAVLLLIMLIGEIVTGLTMRGTDVVFTLLSEAASLMVLAGMLWGGGDIAILLIDLGHDIRVSRILLGRINSQLHESTSSTEIDDVRRKDDLAE